MIRLASLALCLSLPTAALAQSVDTHVSASTTVDAARSKMEEIARTIDADRDGAITEAELLTAGKEIFASIDTDGSGAASAAEFLGWEYGLSDMAAFRGRAQAFDAAMGMVFDLYDRDRSREITAAEFDTGMSQSLAYADVSGDGAMDFPEFYTGFLVNVALRNAMVDD